MPEQQTGSPNTTERKRRADRYRKPYPEIPVKAAEPKQVPMSSPAPKQKTVVRETAHTKQAVPSPVKTDTYHNQQMGGNADIPAAEKNPVTAQRQYPVQNPQLQQNQYPVQNAYPQQNRQYPVQNAYPQQNQQYPVQNAYPQQNQYPVRNQYPPQNRYPGQTPYQNPVYPSQQVPQPGYARSSSLSQSYPIPSMNTTGQIPPVPPVPPEPHVPPHHKRKPMPRWVRKALMMLAAAIVVFILVCVVQSIRHQSEYNQLVQEVEAYSGCFCEGVYVDGISLGGMTPAEAWNAVSAQAAESLANWSVQVTFDGNVVATLNAAVLGLSVDPTDALNEAWKQGHSSADPAELKAARDELTEHPFYAYSVESDADLSALDTILEDVEEELYIAPQDASIARFDAELSYPFVFNEEVVGRELDLEGLKSQLVDMFQSRTSGSVELQVSYVQPSTTVEYLKKYIVSEMATVYTDISTRSTENRNKNIRQALSKVNGTVVKPGETFSFNAAAGDRTLANGYYEAPEYVYSQEVMGVGGGVCQASTTVYQAAIYAGMTIVDRSPHSLVVNYSEFGKDATVNSTKGHRVDLKFKNNTEYPIYIKSAVESKEGNRSRLVTRVTIYGPYKGDGVTYDFDISEEVIPAPTEAQIVVDKDSEYAYYENEEYEYQAAKDGVKVTSYQVKYVNGVEESRVYLDTDTYDPKPQILYVGIYPAETE